MPVFFNAKTAKKTKLAEQTLCESQRAFGLCVELSDLYGKVFGAGISLDSGFERRIIPWL